MGKLDGKVALVTGAGVGFGPGISRALAGEGADVVLADLTVPPIEGIAKAIAEFGRRAVPIACDLRDPAQIEQMVAKGVEELGPIDILVNNGQRGGSADGSVPLVLSLEDISDDVWDHTFDIGVKAAFRCSKAVFPHMRGRGGKI